jgi:hypothetical protein
VPRGDVVNARRPGHRPGRSEAESIDDVEHGTSILGAMVVRFDSRTDRGHVLRASRAYARTDFCRSYLVSCWHGTRHAGGAILLHRSGTQTGTRATASDGVNDPVRAPWGQAPGTVPGSFTPSFLQ